MASVIIAQLLFLEAENPKKEISMYINSPGGVVTAGMAIYDTMQFIKPKVSTLCVGQAASMGSLLLCGGDTGMRFALPNAQIMVHQPSGGFQGQASDILRHAEDIMKVKKRLNEVYVKHTGQDYETIEKTLDRDHFMSSEEAMAFGLIDNVLSKRPERKDRREEVSRASRMPGRWSEAPGARGRQTSKRRDLRQSLSFASISLNWPIDVSRTRSAQGRANRRSGGGVGEMVAVSVRVRSGRSGPSRRPKER